MSWSVEGNGKGRVFLVRKGNGKGREEEGGGRERRTHFIVPSVQRPEIDSAKEPVHSRLAQPCPMYSGHFPAPFKKEEREREADSYSEDWGVMRERERGERTHSGDPTSS